MTFLSSQGVEMTPPGGGFKWTLRSIEIHWCMKIRCVKISSTIELEVATPTKVGLLGYTKNFKSWFNLIMFIYWDLAIKRVSGLIEKTNCTLGWNAAGLKEAPKYQESRLKLIGKWDFIHFHLNNPLQRYWENRERNNEQCENIRCYKML